MEPEVTDREWSAPTKRTVIGEPPEQGVLAETAREELRTQDVRGVTPLYKASGKNGAPPEVPPKPAINIHTESHYQSGRLTRDPDYKEQLDMENYRLRIIDPKVISHSNMPAHATLPAMKHSRFDLFPSIHSKRSFQKLDPLAQPSLQKTRYYDSRSAVPDQKPPLKDDLLKELESLTKPRQPLADLTPKLQHLQSDFPKLHQLSSVYPTPSPTKRTMRKITKSFVIKRESHEVHEKSPISASFVSPEQKRNRMDSPVPFYPGHPPRKSDHLPRVFESDDAYLQRLYHQYRDTVERESTAEPSLSSISPGSRKPILKQRSVDHLPSLSPRKPPSPTQSLHIRSSSWDRKTTTTQSKTTIRFVEPDNLVSAPLPLSPHEQPHIVSLKPETSWKLTAVEPDAKNEIVNSEQLLKEEQYSVDLQKLRDSFVEKPQPTPPLFRVGKRWNPPEEGTFGPPEPKEPPPLLLEWFEGHKWVPYVFEPDFKYETKQFTPDSSPPPVRRKKLAKSIQANSQPDLVADAEINVFPVKPLKLVTRNIQVDMDIDFPVFDDVVSSKPVVEKRSIQTDTPKTIEHRQATTSAIELVSPTSASVSEVPVDVKFRVIPPPPPPAPTDNDRRLFQKLSVKVNDEAQEVKRKASRNFVTPSKQTEGMDDFPKPPKTNQQPLFENGFGVRSGTNFKQQDESGRITQQVVIANPWSPVPLPGVPVLDSSVFYEQREEESEEKITRRYVKRNASSLNGYESDHSFQYRDERPRSARSGLRIQNGYVPYGTEGVRETIDRFEESQRAEERRRLRKQKKSRGTSAASWNQIAQPTLIRSYEAYPAIHESYMKKTTTKRYNDRDSRKTHSGGRSYGSMADIIDDSHGTSRGTKRYNTSSKKSQSHKDLFRDYGNEDYYASVSRAPFVEFPPTLPRAGSSMSDQFYDRRGRALQPYRDSRDLDDWRSFEDDTSEWFPDKVKDLRTNFQQSLLSSMPMPGQNLHQKDYKEEAIPGGKESVSKELDAKSGIREEADGTLKHFSTARQQVNYKREMDGHSR